MIDERRTEGPLDPAPSTRSSAVGSQRVRRGRSSAETRQPGSGRSGGRRPPRPGAPTAVAGQADRPGTPPTRSLAPTQAIFRLLLLRGLSETEAANLTAFLCGLPVGERPWQLREVNQLLFLRELHRRGLFERGEVPPGLDVTPPPLA